MYSHWNKQIKRVSYMIHILKICATIWATILFPYQKEKLSKKWENDTVP